ncbi:MAG: glycosyltransferase [Acidimicrobiia bacterium]
MTTHTEPVRTVAPPVVAVVVTHDPGAWFTETLDSLAAQDYPALSVVVIDAASSVDPSPRVHTILPGALVRRLKGNEGFGASANEVLKLVEGAAFFLLCHDDIALESSAVRLLVEEAYRSNAAVCGPKQVRWDDPSRLVSVGVDVDRVGHCLSVCEAGELDQEQHDAVRDVFVVAGGCQLVRADLFTSLGGFDPAITFYGDDLDLCWRAHVAGARVLIVPSARVRHRSALEERRPDLDRTSLVARHRRLVQRSTSSAGHRLRAVPGSIVGTIGEVLGPLVGRRFGESRAAFGALVWSYRQGGQVRRRRRFVAEHRAVSDGEVANLQISSIDRFRRALRAGSDADDRFGTVSRLARRFIDQMRGDENRVARTLAVVLAVVFVVAARDLIRGGVPAIGEFGQFRRSAFSQLRDYLDGVRSTGLAPTGTPSTGVALLGIVSLLCGGALGLARTVSVIGPLVLGWIGVWVSSRFLGSASARAAAVVAYVVNPLPYNAIAQGHWGAVVVYGCLPWMVAPVFDAARRDRRDPYGFAAEVGGWDDVRLIARSGLATAVAMAFEPLAVALLAMVVVAIVIALLVAGRLPALSGVMRVGAGAVVAALVLNLPWTIALARGTSAWSAIGGVKPAAPGGLDAYEVLRFATGPVGAGVLGLALLLPGLFAVVAARAERMTEAIWWWAIVTGSVTISLLAQRGVISRPIGPAELALAPAALALAMLVGVAIITFRSDVSGTRFGINQPLGFICLAGAVLAVVPPLAALGDGSFGLPGRDFDRTLAFLDQSGQARTVWIGDPASMPVGSWWMADGLAWSITDRPRTDVSTRWAAAPTDDDMRVKEALNLAGAGDTVRLGRLLGPSGVRYVIVARRGGPALSGAEEHPVPASLADVLAAQLDLRRVDIDDALVVYENTSWIPVRAALSAGAFEASSSAGPSSLVTSDVSRSAPVLSASGRRFEGPVPAGSTLYLAHPFSNDWKVSVDGQRIDPQPAFGWSAIYSVPLAGEVTVERATPWARRGAVAAQALAWLVAMVLASRTARRRLAPKQTLSTHIGNVALASYGDHVMGHGGVPAAVATAALAVDEWPSDGWAVEPGPTVDPGVLPWGAAVESPVDPLWDEADAQESGEILAVWEDRDLDARDLDAGDDRLEGPR